MNGKMCYDAELRAIKLCDDVYYLSGLASGIQERTELFVHCDHLVLLDVWARSRSGMTALDNQI